jgi:outer membrane protein TolC
MMMLWLTAALGAPLTFQDSLEEALARGPAVAVAEAQRRSNLGEAQSTGSWTDNPSVSLEQDIEGKRATVSLPVPLAGQPLARGVARGALRDAAELGGTVGRARAALSVGRAYLEAERAEQLARLAGETLAVAERNRDAARQLLEAREVSEVDAVTLAALAARAVQDATTAQQQALAARLAFESALGREPIGEASTAGWPDLPVPEGTDPARLPDAALAADQARAARALATASRMDLLPTPTVTGGWEERETEAGPSIGLSFPIPLFAPGLGRVRTAAAESDRLAAVATQAQLQAKAEWAAAQGELVAAQRAYEASQVEGLLEGLQAIGIALEAGEYSLAEYTARRDALVDGLITAIETRYRLEIARLVLWELKGELPPEMTP